MAGKSHIKLFFGQKWAVFGHFWVSQDLQKIFYRKIHESIIDCGCNKHPYMDFT